ncbi:hypothetical protein LSUE1_G009803 [Lachnellula suecica]|uniref:Uncharacterized protein n=1 Tax=Lachnellula suecica TaxID=602035 RepID=A0A8T9BTC5_9HELO|nr:hypothetical protein LSUE1_G009803 [Lachnellula suecica]
MQSSLPHRNTSYISLGERRGKSDLARFSLDTSWARAVSDDSARSRAYPSPPMSGSPPLPARRNPDSSDRGHGNYGPSGQDVFSGTRTPQSEVSNPRGPPMRPYQPEQQPPATYSPYRMEDPALGYQQQRGPPLAPQLVQQQLQQQQQQQQQHHQQQHQQQHQHQHQHQLQHPHPAYRQQIPQAPAPFSTPDRPRTGEGPEYSASPKAQRKTKGHVASACVPCKRAHLRQVSERVSFAKWGVTHIGGVIAALQTRTGVFSHDVIGVTRKPVWCGVVWCGEV